MPDEPEVTLHDEAKESLERMQSFSVDQLAQENRGTP